MAHAERPPWTVAPSLGVFVAALALAVFVLDGNLRDLTRLPVRKPAAPPTTPTAPRVDDTAPEDTVDAPLPPKPDLAPERSPGGAPVSIPGQTVEDVCVE